LGTNSSKESPQTRRKEKQRNKPPQEEARETHDPGCKITGQVKPTIVHRVVEKLGFLVNWFLLTGKIGRGEPGGEGTGPFLSREEEDPDSRVPNFSWPYRKKKNRQNGHLVARYRQRRVGRSKKGRRLPMVGALTMGVKVVWPQFQKCFRIRARASERTRAKGGE